MRSTRSRSALLLAAALTVAGCGSTARESAPTPDPTRSTLAPSATPTPTTPAPSPTRTSKAASPALSAPTKVLVVIEENHSYAQMRAGMPFLAKESATYGYATHWTAITHPSEPNYLAIAGGSTFGISDDKAPAAHEGDIGNAPSVFDEALKAGKSAATYAESMPENCHVYDYPDRSKGVPKYAVRHNPWVYFTQGRSDCLAHDVALPQFTQDAAAGSLPNVGFLIPDLDHDAHDGSLAAADAWLEQQLTPVLHSEDFTSGRLVVVVTADEDDKASGNNVLTTVLSPHLSHKVVTDPLTHYSLNRYLTEVLGVPPLGEGATAPDLKSAFGL